MLWTCWLLALEIQPVDKFDKDRILSQLDNSIRLFRDRNVDEDMEEVIS